MIRYYFIILLFLLSFSHIRAQQTTYPMQVDVHLLPPYSLFLSDYYSGSREKLTVTLINRDQFQPSINVRLRMSITAPGGVKLKTNDNYFVDPIRVETNLPVRLTLNDLAPYFQPNALVSQGFLTDGKLPEGMIEFCFEAVEVNTGRAISVPSCTRAWISAQKPPLLSLPLNNEQVVFRDPLNLMFQWTPRHQGLTYVEYEFILKELWDNGMPPQSAFAYSPEIYRETVRTTSLIYGPFQPPLLAGKKYAWCVRAQARDGIEEVNLFQNSGYSEIRWFTIQGNCPPPQAVAATTEGKRIALEWPKQYQHIGYTVSYRLVENTTATNGSTTPQPWKDIETPDTRATLYGLKSGGTYEYRVGGYCISGQPVYTPVFQVTLGNVDSARLQQCGIMPAINLNNKTPLPQLRVGEVIMANDYPVTIEHVTGGNGVYTGYGWTVIPWLNDVKVAVEFTSITINTDKQMIAGYVEAQYDKKEGQIANLDKVFEGGYDVGNVVTGLTRTDTVFDFSIPGVESFTLNNDGDLVITDSEDSEHVIPVQKDLNGQGNEGNKFVVFPLTVRDKDGNVYLVEKVTETDATGKQVERVVATAIGKSGQPLAPGSFDPTQLDADKAIVTFEKGSGRYAFDTWNPYYEKVTLIVNKYQKLSANYYAPWKLLTEGQSDEVRAVIEIKDQTIKPELVIFKTPAGVEYTSQLSNGAYTLTVTAGPVNDVQEVYALYPKGNNKYYTLGKLNIATYHTQNHKVVLVPVNSVHVDKAAIEKKLEETYGPIGITWQVDLDPGLTYTTNYRLMTAGTGLSTYNDDMRALNAAYKAARGNDFDPKANYVFFLLATGAEAINDRDLTGFMPRGAQFGYIFTSEVKDVHEPVTVAHELAHGRWKLYHTFDEHYGGFKKLETDNLMDYANGNYLAKWQWDVMNDPAMLVSVFESDNASAYSSSEYFTKLLQQIRCAYISKIDAIEMPEKYRPGGDKVDVGLVYGLSTPQSEINGLKLSRAWWTATANKSNITGIKNPIVNASKGEINFGNFSIKVPVEVYNMNSGVSPFEHFRQYLLPSESNVIAEFNSVWDDGIKQKIEGNKKISSEDIVKLKAIASCGTKYLDVNSRYKLIQAIMNYSTTEYYEDLVLDIIQTTPSGNQSKILFQAINANKNLLIEMVTSMDNLWGDEKNFDRLAKEYLALFQNGYDKAAQYSIYERLSEDHKLYFYGFGVPHCEWTIETSRDDANITFEETEIYDYEQGHYIPNDISSTASTCREEENTYIVPLQGFVIVNFSTSSFIAQKDNRVLMPAIVYYAMIKSKMNEQLYNSAVAAWTILTTVTPYDEFYFLGKAIQYAPKVFRALRLKKVKVFAEAEKLNVPLNDKGLKLKDESAGEIDKYVNWNVSGPRKTELLTKFKDFTNIKSWVNGLDEIADARLLSKLDNLEASYFTKFDADLVHATYGPEIKALLKESPDDLVDIWKRLKDDPAYSWELQKTGGSRWEKWSKREFFKDITAKGKGFETDVCLATFKNRSSAKYLELKQKFFDDFGKNLDDYDMYSQVQLKYDGDNYFVADQLFLKRNALGDIDDLVVIENKLSSSTPLTTPQSMAFTKNSFTVRSQNLLSQFGSGTNLTSGKVLKFSGTKQWYKVHDGANGDVISGISKMK